MKTSRLRQMDFIVDKLTNSIENVKTGDSFATEISLLTRSDLMAVNKNDSWLFNWSERNTRMLPRKSIS